MSDAKTNLFAFLVLFVLRREFFSVLENFLMLLGHFLIETFFPLPARSFLTIRRIFILIESTKIKQTFEDSPTNKGHRVSRVYKKKFHYYVPINKTERSLIRKETSKLRHAAALAAEVARVFSCRLHTPSPPLFSPCLCFSLCLLTFLFSTELSFQMIDEIFISI